MCRVQGAWCLFATDIARCAMHVAHLRYSFGWNDYLGLYVITTDPNTSSCVSPGRLSNWLVCMN